MSRGTRTYSLALAALLALASPSSRAQAAEPPQTALGRFLEDELAAARQRDLYLVLASDGRSIDVRARGIVLDTLPLADITVLNYRKWRGTAAGADLPHSWEVQTPPSDAHRQLIAPEELQPYDAEAEAAATPPGILPEPPSSYNVGLDGGWELWVRQELPEASFWGQLRRVWLDGWRRLRLEKLQRPPVVVFTVGVLEGQRLHQLFREGRRILIDPTRLLAEPASATPPASEPESAGS